MWYTRSGVGNGRAEDCWSPRFLADAECGRSFVDANVHHNYNYSASPILASSQLSS